MCSNVGERGTAERGDIRGKEGGELEGGGEYTGPSAERNDEDPAQGQIDEGECDGDGGTEGHGQECHPSLFIADLFTLPNR